MVNLESIGPYGTAPSSGSGDPGAKIAREMARLFSGILLFLV